MAKLNDLRVEWISLVKRPANGRGVVLKAADSRAHSLRLLRAAPAQHRLYGIVYSPDEHDAHGDWADAQTIVRAADRFMREGRAPAVDHEHDFEAVPAFVAESWIIRPRDPLFADEREGAWAVGIQVEDAALWEAIAAGEVEGISLAGTARVTRGQDASRTTGLMDRMHGFFVRRGAPAHPHGDPDMTPDEVLGIVRTALAEREQDAASQQLAAAQAATLAALQAEVAALKSAAPPADRGADIDAQAATLAALQAEVETLKKAAPAKGAGEGGSATAPTSFI